MSGVMKITKRTGLQPEELESLIIKKRRIIAGIDDLKDGFGMA
jgi:hypothetical protein